MDVIGQTINMGLYGKRQRSPAKYGQVVKPQEPISLRIKAPVISSHNSQEPEDSDVYSVHMTDKHKIN